MMLDEHVASLRHYALACPGDSVMLLTTSGRSPNVINAAHVARDMGVGVIALTGRAAAALTGIADVCIQVPADSVDGVQDMHAPVCHGLAPALEVEFFGAQAVVISSVEHPA